MEAERSQILALGGGASNALDHLIRTGGLAASLVAVNTDAQDLRRSLAPTKLQIGAQLIRGLGCGGDPEVGRDCAFADRPALGAVLAGAELVVVLVGLGGGTGSGVAPVVCEVAGELGGRVLVVATLPYPFEGRRRRRVADDALAALTEAARGRVIVAETPTPPESEARVTMQELFARSDSAMATLVRGALDIADGGSGDTLELGVAAAVRAHLAAPGRD